MTHLEMTPISDGGEARPFLVTGEDLEIDIEMVAHADVPQANIAAILYDSSGFRLIDTNTGLHGSYIDFRAGQTANVRFRFKNLLLKPGVYLLGLQVFRSGVGDMDGIQYAASLVVEANTALTQATEIYPGPYQCAFSHEIVLRDSGGLVATKMDATARRAPNATPVVR
jgi:hypothetical protein